MSSIVRRSALVLLGAAVFLACGSSRPGPGDGGGGSGGSGNSSGGSGGSGGSGASGGSGGSGASGGSGGGSVIPTTIAAAKQAPNGSHVQLAGVVVTAVDDSYAATSSFSSCTTAMPRGWYASFWVADPAASSPQGIYVYKHCTDTPTDYQPVVGDVVDIDGYAGFESIFQDREARRWMVKSQFDFVFDGGTKAFLIITKKGTMAPLADNAAPLGFGDADGGWGRPNKEYAGSRVSIPGPLVLDNATPTALHRVSGFGANDTQYYGFQVASPDGGYRNILVNNYKTYRDWPADGGTGPGCDWRKRVIDGGFTVKFPNGIAGVWDTYSHAPCQDGGTDVSKCNRNQIAGKVPGTTNDYTYVLYPQDCADLAGVATP